MNIQQPPQANIEQPATYIQDRELALEVAYGEMPHIEAAQEAMEAGKFQETAGHLALAESSGITAGNNYIEAEQARVSSLREQIGIGANPEAAETESTFETKVTATIAAMAERYKAKPEDFSLISFEREDGTKVNTVMYTAPQGLDLGEPTQTRDQKRSYNAVMNDNSHILEIDGQKVDTRTGSTAEAYKAFINQEIANQTSPLPDSQDLAPWTLTLLTGERAGSDRARYGDVDGDESRVDWFGRDNGRQVVRFRPAVEISEN